MSGTLVVVTLLLVMCSGMCVGSTVDWSWSFGQGYFAHFGTSTSASDDADAHDMLVDNSQYWYYATYHEYNVDGWTGDSGFYCTDIRAPLQLVAGQSKTWVFYLWADPSLPLGPSGDHLELMWGWNQPAPSFDTTLYVLKYARVAQGVTEGNIPVGTSVVLNHNQQGTWSFPVYRTTDGRTGYMFELTATVIPEPSSLLALAAGLAPLAGLAIRRKK